MADAQEPMSKRERQKARRQQKLEAEAAAQRSEKTRKSLATGLVLALVVGLLGVWGFSAWTDRQERNERIAQAQENREALGCTEVEEIPIADSPHLSGDQLNASPPDALYPDRPTTSGPHLPSVATSGFFDKVVDERLLVHNLEHGYINIYYDDGLPEDQVADIEAFVGEQLDGLNEKVLATRWNGELPEDGNVALTAWGARQICQEWDRGLAEAFIDQYHYLEGTAPERTIQPHRGGQSGGIDPDETEGDLLFPPLDAAPESLDVEEDVMDAPPGNTEEGEEGPREDADLDVEDGR